MAILRAMTLVFLKHEAAEKFYYFTKGFFQGSLDAGTEFDSPRVHIRGMRAGEAQMFAREASKTGGYIELVQQQPNQNGDRANA